MENLILLHAAGAAAPMGEIIAKKKQRLAFSAKIGKFMCRKSVTWSHFFLVARNEQTGQHALASKHLPQDLVREISVAIQPPFFFARVDQLWHTAKIL